MKENMEVYEKVRNVPPEALKEIKGGRLKGMSDINPMWRIKMLTEVFGICGIGWKTEIVDKRLEKGEGIEVVCFVDINLYVKVDGEWSAPIPGMGGNSFVTMERNGPFTSDECFKMAYTDAIGVACKSLGFAADVYFNKDRTKYSDQENDSNAPTTPSHSPRNEHRQSRQQSNRTSQTHQEGATDSNRSSYTPSAQSRVYKLRERLGMEWADLNKLAGNVLGREVKFLKSNVKKEEEWVLIENTLKEALQEAS